MIFRQFFLIAIALLIPLFFGFIFIASAFNKLASLRNRILPAASELHAQLQCWHALVSKLVETIQPSLPHERCALEAVTVACEAASTANAQAASNPGSAAAITRLAGAESDLRLAWRRIFALVEGSSGLKTNPDVNPLLEELNEVEKKVRLACQVYDEAVKNYNAMRETFPNNLVAQLVRFEAAAVLGLS